MQRIQDGWHFMVAGLICWAMWIVAPAQSPVKAPWVGDALFQSIVAGDQMAAWKALTGHYSNHGIEIDSTLNVRFNPYTMPISYYDPAANRINISEMPPEGRGWDYWDNFSELLTDNDWNLRAEFEDEVEARGLANFIVVLTMAHELGHYAELRYPQDVLERGDWEMHANLLAVAILHDCARNLEMSKLASKYFYMAHSYLERKFSGMVMQDGMDANGLAREFEVDFEPKDMGKIRLYVAYQFALQQAAFRGEGSLGFKGVLKRLGLPNESDVPMWEGECRVEEEGDLDLQPPGVMDMQWVKDAYREDGIQGMGVMDRSGNTFLFVIQRGEDGHGRKGCHLEITKDPELVRLDAYVFVPAMPNDAEMHVLDFVFRGNGKGAAILRYLYNGTERIFLADLDLDNSKVLKLKPMKHFQSPWFHALQGEVERKKLFASPDGRLWLVTIGPFEKGCRSMGVHALENGWHKPEPAQFLQLCGSELPYDCAVDNDGRLWCTERARCRVLVADSGKVYVAAGNLRGFRNGVGRDVAFFYPRTLQWADDGGLWVGDFIKVNQEAGTMETRPIVRRLKID
jgi:hypothetical protein